ncbi:MAG TPA: 50S ribosomal protein L18 [Candidatus Gracilibacteria bacterium]
MSEKTLTIAHRKDRSRRTHVKARVTGRPRLIVFRSNKAIYAQIFDDETGKAIAGVSSLKSKKKGVEAAAEVGKTIAELGKAKKIKEVSFDRNGYRYHGRVKALADSAREGGLQF